MGDTYLIRHRGLVPVAAKISSSAGEGVSGGGPPPVHGLFTASSLAFAQGISKY